ncbi:MAG TPA: T9SS type A sorting domain-containing protein [Flavipsychrobacter sp.]|nr:T9SS type A sorting domain-containing protein [Flavipsychrobacter sp.]
MKLKLLLSAFLLLCITDSYAQSSRLRAHVDYFTATTPPYTTSMIDSSLYVYLGHRALAADGTTWLYDSSLTYNAVYAPFGINAISARVYSGNNILTDSSFRNDTASHSWVTMDATNYTYDSHSNKTSITSANNRTVNFYNASNYLIADSAYAWNNTSNSWQGSTVDSFTYDAHGNLTIDRQTAYWSSTSTWANYLKVYYYYNAANELDSTNTYYEFLGDTAWVLANRGLYIYDAHHNLVTDSSLDGSSTGGWIVDRLNFFSYTTANDISSILTYLYTAANPYSKKLFTYDAHHNKLTDTLSLYDAGSSSYLYYQLNTYTYNSDNFVLIHSAYLWQGSLKWFGGMSEQNYYDAYLAVPTVATQSANNIVLYPLPANTVMNIDMHFDQPQQGTMAIYDASGRLYRQWQFNSTANYHGGISVSQLPAGSYVLKVLGNNTQYAQRFSVVH